MQFQDLKDVNLIDYKNLINKDGFYFTFRLGGSNAATASNYGYIFTARHPIEILRVTEIHETAGTVNPTLDVKVVPSGTAIGSGASILATTFDLSSTSNTPVFKEGSDLTSARRLKENQSLALVAGGTLTTLAGICVTIYCQNYGMGSYK